MVVVTEIGYQIPVFGACACTNGIVQSQIMDCPPTGISPVDIWGRLLQSRSRTLAQKSRVHILFILLFLWIV